MVSSVAELIAAAVVGSVVTVVGLVAMGGLLLSAAGPALFGGAFDPVTGAVAVGLGAAALGAARRRQPATDDA